MAIEQQEEVVVDQAVALRIDLGQRLPAEAHGDGPCPPSSHSSSVIGWPSGRNQANSTGEPRILRPWKKRGRLSRDGRRARRSGRG